MKKAIFWIIVLSLTASLTACNLLATPTPEPTLAPTATSAPTDTPEPTVTSTPTDTPTPTLEPTPLYPPEGLGPTNFPLEVDPLTGLVPGNPDILNRRPIIIKVENLPRRDRPQYGLSLADIVYEYYTEQGSTRFSAVYYGQDATQVMPIRSARYIDLNFIRMYKSIFVFGSAYAPIYQRLINSEYSAQMILERPDSCPAVCRFDPNGKRFLYADTATLQSYLAGRGIDNSRPNLDGMFFKLEAPEGGEPANQVFARFSGAIYNRWDYDQESGKYLRFSDSADDINHNNEQYTQLTDELTKQPIAFDNLVVMLVRYTEVDPRPETEVLDVSILGSGPAYIARDGKLYAVKWSRMAEDQVLTLTYEDGTPFPFKPGQTWVEVLASNSAAEQEGDAWRFTFVSDW